MTRSLLTLLLFLAAFLLNVTTIYACGCEPRQTTLKKYQNADVVVVAKITKLEKVKDPPYPEFIRVVRSTTMLVEKSFKGGFKKGDEFLVGQGGGIRCDWTFFDHDVGKTYLLYLRYSEKVEGLWSIWGCRTSLRIDFAYDDLLYLNKMNEVRGQTRVSGLYGSELLSVTDEEEGANKLVKIIGRTKTYTATTNEHGVYELYGLPPGRYRLEAPIPSGLMIDDKSYEDVAGVAPPESMPKNQIIFTLRPKAHAAIDVIFKDDQGIRGRVFGPNGKPLLGVDVTLIKAEDFSKSDQDSTDWKGRFEFDSVSPGNYIVALNLAGKKTSEEPFQTLFYPNSATREKAEIITVVEGDSLKNLKIVIPDLDETVTVKGIVLESKHQLACYKADVLFEADQAPGIEGNTSSSVYDGAFSLKLLKGVQGEIYAKFKVSSGDYENCSQVEEMIKQNGKKFATVRSRPIKITARENLRGLVLRFPFPQCRPSHQ
jgi:hypothetical protein